MTPLNLATIFGPNLLHKQKNPDKEFAVESLVRAEESTAIISVVQKMISTYDTLFTVSYCKQKQCPPLAPFFIEGLLTLNDKVAVPLNKILKLTEEDKAPKSPIKQNCLTVKWNPCNSFFSTEPCAVRFRGCLFPYMASLTEEVNVSHSSLCLVQRQQFGVRAGSSSTFCFLVFTRDGNADARNWSMCKWSHGAKKAHTTLAPHHWFCSSKTAVNYFRLIACKQHAVCVACIAPRWHYINIGNIKLLVEDAIYRM